MKPVTFIFSLLLLASCNDAMRRPIGTCHSADNQVIQCGTSNALTSEEFQTMYYAEITTPISVGQSQIIIKEAAKDEDSDKDFTCDLDISANKQFNYSLENGNLILKDGISTLILIRKNGADSESLIGSWAMENTVGKVLTKTELIFNHLEEIRIRKTCYLK